MRPASELYYAGLLRDQRTSLEDLMSELADRGEPLTGLEARPIAEAVARLSEVENALRHDAGRRRRGGPRVARFRGMTQPRIGVLRQYTPRPLTVPATYFRERLPDDVPTISIVTPSFQQGRFLDRTLYSVVRQAYPRLEYVVEDGGSSDDSVETLERFDHLLSRWRSEPDAGQGDAINRGFAETTGQVMAWLNSDDILLPGSLAYVARYLSTHPDVDVVYGHRIMIDQNDGQIGAWILPAHDDLALTLGDYVPQETLFWRRRIWNAVGGGVDPTFAYALDWDLLLRFREAGARMARLPRFIGAFRVHGEQKTTVLDDLGALECDRLRERIHGRALSRDEVLHRLRPYFRRHVRAHTWQRMLDRLPVRREHVTTMPTEPRLRRPEPKAGPERGATAGDAPEVSPLLPVERDGVEPLPARGRDVVASHARGRDS